MFAVGVGVLVPGENCAVHTLRSYGIIAAAVATIIGANVDIMREWTH
jgi:hypothetical protein